MNGSAISKLEGMQRECRRRATTSAGKRCRGTGPQHSAKKELHRLAVNTTACQASFCFLGATNRNNVLLNMWQVP
jgi:hypothetical protein